MNRVFSLVTIFVATQCIVAQAAEVSLTPSKDNTIFEEDSNLSNGSGRYLFAGTTAGKQGTTLRRALMAFDVAGNVPVGATITEATLTLNMNKTVSGGHDTSLHRVVQDWGEGGSNASGQEGRGTPAQTGDATWEDTFLGTSAWTNSGGDFADTASDTISVARNGTYTWGTGGALNSDVQLWLDDPTLNFGWILIGNEPVSRSAKRFDSREASSESNRPTLTISFDETLAGDCNGDGVVDIGEQVPDSRSHTAGHFRQREHGSSRPPSKTCTAVPAASSGRLAARTVESVNAQEAEASMGTTMKA